MATGRAQGPEPTTNPNLAAALGGVAGRISPERIDQVWLFPARQLGARESGLAVLSIRGEGEQGHEQRMIYTLRYEAETLKGKLQRSDVLEEQGTVPADRVGRIIAGVVRRLQEAEVPDARDVGGDPERWEALLVALRPAP